MAKTKNTAPPKSKAQAIREAIGRLVTEGRDVTTAAILSLLPSLGIKNAKAADIYQSDAWKELREKEKAGQSGASEPSPERTKQAGLPVAAQTTDGISKTEAVRQALAILGSDAKPKAVIEHVKEQHGLEVSAQTVSNFKALQAKKTTVTGKRRGRPLKVQAVVVAVVTPRPVRTMPTGEISLEDIRAVKGLADKLGVEKVRQLADILA